MRATFYIFEKRLNSTKQPSGGTQFEIVLKQPSSIHNPTFRIQTDNFNYNYVYVQEFNSFYWIKEVISVTKDVWEFKCKIDVLATYKSDIGSYSAYVLYDEVGNANIVDSRLGMQSVATNASNEVALRDDCSNAGTFVVSLTGQDSVGTYVIPGGNINRLLPDIKTQYDGKITGADTFDAIRDCIYQLVGSGSVPSNIRNLRWIPFVFDGDTLVSPVYIGLYDIGIGLRKIDNRLSVKVTDVAIPWQVDDWRRCEPYTEVYLYIPYVGVVSYPASVLRNKSIISIKTSLDKYTGDLSIVVYSGTDLILGAYGASTGVAVALGQSNLNPMSIVNSILQGGGALMTGNIGGLVGAGINAVSPLNQSVGGISNGSAVGLGHNVRCYTNYRATSTAPASVKSIMGIPAYATKTISTLSGYIQCSNASLELDNANYDEIQEVNSFLNNGFYYE